MKHGGTQSVKDLGAAIATTSLKSSQQFTETAIKANKMLSFIKRRFFFPSPPLYESEKQNYNTEKNRQMEYRKCISNV